MNYPVCCLVWSGRRMWKFNIAGISKNILMGFLMYIKDDLKIRVLLRSLWGFI